MSPRRAPKPTHDQAGFTLLEAMVAVMIVAMVVASFLAIRTNAVADGMEARNWRLARELAEEKMSELQAGARETPAQSGQMMEIEKYRDFTYTIAIGETAIGELESKIAEDQSEGGNEQASARQEWQRNRDSYLKASASGKSYSDYQDQRAQEDYQRELQEKPPDETELEDVAVAVFFPKLNANFEGQKEAFLIKSKASTLALSGLTPDQAKLVAESKGQSTPAAGGSTPGGANGAGNNAANGATK